MPGTGLADHGDTDTVKQIVAELGEFEPARARFLAAFAYVLSRVAHADSAVCVNETKTMQEIVQKLGHLPEAQAALVVEIARNQASRPIAWRERKIGNRSLANATLSQLSYGPAAGGDREGCG